MDIRTTRQPALPGGITRQLLAWGLSLLFILIGYIGSHLFTSQHPTLVAATYPTLPYPEPAGAGDTARRLIQEGQQPQATPELVASERATTDAPWMQAALSPPLHDAIDAPLVTTRAAQGKTSPGRLANPGADATAPVPETAAAMSAALTLPAPIEGIIKKGQTAVGIFRQAGVAATQVMELQRALHSVYDLRLLRTGQPYRIQLTSDGALQSFTYEIDAEDRLEVAYQGETFTGHIEPIRYTRRERVVSGRIDDSVHATLMAQDESPRLVSDFANIFAWVIDFDTDLRQGDTFRLLIEERWRDGKLPQYHRILAAELINRERVWQAVYYVHDQQEVYYQPDGRSLRGMFLRSPLQYTRISSRFTHRRFHPILKSYRPHLGVDYAAPYGTPVRSVAAGTVRWAGNKGASGQMIQIHHNHTYTTYYLHLSRLARGIRRGSRVQQGQIIGYVGSTGLSTGPHLDFRLTQHGKYINPLTHKSIEVPPLSPQVLPAFRTYAQDILAKLSQPESVLQRSAASAEGKEQPDATTRAVSRKTDGDRF